MVAPLVLLARRMGEVGGKRNDVEGRRMDKNSSNASEFKLALDESFSVRKLGKGT